MTSNAHTEDERNHFHPDNLRYPHSDSKDHRFNKEGPYNYIDVIRAEMGQLRNWQIYEDGDKSNPKASQFADFLVEADKKNEADKQNTANEKELRKHFQKAIFNEKLTALCLSGGGIRSASFCLGVLQALSKEKMLSGFDYISTVSGGGYIGGWLSAWASHNKQPPEPANCLRKSEAIGIEAVQEALSSRIECDQITNLRKYTNFLSPRVGFMSLDTRVFWITYLRNLFLNTLLFIPALLAFLAIVKFLAMLILYIAGASQLKYPHSYFFQFEWLNLSIVAYFMLHIFLSHKMMQSRPVEPDQQTSVRSRLRKWIVLIKKDFLPIERPGWIRKSRIWKHEWLKNKIPDLGHNSIRTGNALDFLLSLGLNDVKLTTALYYTVIGITSAGIMTSPTFSKIIICEKINIWGAYYLLCLVLSSGAVWLVSYLIAWSVQDEPVTKNDPNEYLIKLVAIFVGGVVACLILYFGFRILNRSIHGFYGLENFLDPITSNYCIKNDNSPFETYRLAIFFGPLIPIAADFVGSAIFSAMISNTPDLDDLQEWSARMLALLFMLGGGWLIFSFIAIPPVWDDIPFISNISKSFNSFFIENVKLPNHPDLYKLIIILMFGILAAMYGKSSHTPSGPQANENKEDKLWKSLFLLSGGIFLCLFMLNLSAAFDGFVFPDHELNKIISKFPSITQQLKIEDIIPEFLIPYIPEFLVPATPVGSVLFLLFISFILLAFFTCLFSCFINVNAFSLHRYYRNRLIRSFLGSVNTKRDPDSFTNFDQKDNIYMSNLTEKSPLLIINAALNLLHDDNLAWQERKASSFSISRLFCGNKEVGYRPSKAPEETSDKCKEGHESVSCKQREEIKNHNSQSGYGKNISLGTAMAISGAAVSPNMGYNSSPIITFVMTLFNARLGWWLGNPQYDLWRKIGPRNAICYYISELFGLTDDHQEYIYLSDGGHFENLGAYEMIRRCCRTIVIVDAGCDPDSKFEDLGKLIRLARIDFNAEITFNREFEMTDGEIRHFTPTHAGDNQCPPYCLVGEIEYRDIESRGTIIYIKPGVHGDEPRDVLSYHALHPVFPHEPTSDQFFSESQFESYRKLGSHIGKKVFKALAI